MHQMKTAYFTCKQLRHASKDKLLTLHVNSSDMHQMKTAYFTCKQLRHASKGKLLTLHVSSSDMHQKANCLLYT